MYEKVLMLKKKKAIDKLIANDCINLVLNQRSVLGLPMRFIFKYVLILIKIPEHKQNTLGLGFSFFMVVKEWVSN